MNRFDVNGKGYLQRSAKQVQTAVFADCVRIADQPFR